MDETTAPGKIDNLSKKIDGLIELVSKINKPQSLPDWISEKEAQQLLGLKNTSLWTLRKLRQVKYSKIGGRTFYNLESIKKLLEKNQQ